VRVKDQLEVREDMDPLLNELESLERVQKSEESDMVISWFDPSDHLQVTVSPFFPLKVEGE
jgi:hypothetical protein